MKNVADLVKFGYWPVNKKVIGELSLISLGYQMFYEGKNADIYFIPGETSVLMVRTDRTSVFDILLSDVIEGKGEIQNKISNLGYDFAENIGIKTARLPMPKDIPIEIAVKSQHIQLAEPLMINLNGENHGLELIRRNYLTGSLYEKYKKGEDPYCLNLPKGLKEWYKFEKSIFTPTTKGISDDPIDFRVVEKLFPISVNETQKLFDTFSSFAESKGIISVDTKFEKFSDMFGDEILTPESSRFILKSDFDNGIYNSMDKQILRKYAIDQGWVENGTKGQLLYITIPEEIKKQVLAGYHKVYDMLAA